jgi:hypothetical protein
MAEHGTAEKGKHSQEHHDNPTPVETAPVDTLFDAEEFAQFDRDDTAAGSHIGKMLALFFLYTVIVMALVALWTYNAVTD